MMEYADWARGFWFGVKDTREGREFSGCSGAQGEGYCAGYNRDAVLEMRRAEAEKRAEEKRQEQDFFRRINNPSLGED